MTILFLNASKKEENPSYCVGDCPQIEKNPEPSIEEFGGFTKHRKDSFYSIYNVFYSLMSGSKIIGWLYQILTPNVELVLF